MLILHTLATYFGLSFGCKGVRPILGSYLFNKFEFPITNLEDE